MRSRSSRRGNLLTACGRFLLNKEEATQLVDDLIAKARNEWQSALARAGVSRKDRETIANALVYDGFFFESER